MDEIEREDLHVELVEVLRVWLNVQNVRLVDEVDRNLRLNRQFVHRVDRRYSPNLRSYPMPN